MSSATANAHSLPDLFLGEGFPLVALLLLVPLSAMSWRIDSPCNEI
jgi:hypothetical protein